MSVAIRFDRVGWRCCGLAINQFAPIVSAGTLAFRDVLFSFLGCCSAHSRLDRDEPDRFRTSNLIRRRARLVLRVRRGGLRAEF